VPLRDVVRLQFPLGHYGNPIVIGYTREDLKIWRELVARIMAGVGITEHDIIQVAFNYGLFMGAVRFNQGAELIGAAVVPASIAPADVQIRIMRDFRSTVLVSTPSFALHIIEIMKKKGIDPKELSLKIGLFGAEPWPESARSLIEEGLGIKAFDIYGVSELIEPGVSGECSAKSGLHIFEDHFFPEIIDPVTGQSLKEGEEGELVLTSLTTSAYPLIRYRTHDRTALCTEPCACGRTLVRMKRIFNRTDRMISVRGINVFPEMIAEVLSGIQGIGPEYSLEIKQKDGMNDKLKICIEISPELMHNAESKAALNEKVQSALRKALGLRVQVERREYYRAEKQILTL
jgi:phenylacetate-CoA ligase